MSVPLLKLDAINKVYQNGTAALQNVNLAVYPGEFISLVGPSGCGKSTVLRLVAGLGQPTGGTLDWQTPAQDRHLAFVFQDPALMPWANVVDNVHLPLKLKGQRLRSVRARIQEAINTVALCGCEHSYPRQLSGGMKMRVSIARALVTKPQILLMDEPFGALDEIVRDHLNEQLLQLWERTGKTIAFVTHSIPEAVYLSTKIVVMSPRPGRITDVIESPLPKERPLDIRDTPEFLEIAHRVREGLRAGHSYDD